MMFQTMGVSELDLVRSHKGNVHLLKSKEHKSNVHMLMSISTMYICLRTQVQCTNAKEHMRNVYIFANKRNYGYMLSEMSKSIYLITFITFLSLLFCDETDTLKFDILTLVWCEMLFICML